MADGISDELISSVKEMTSSVNGMQQEFAGMKAEHGNVSRNVERLTTKVEAINGSMIRLDGKSKGLRTDVQRIERGFNRRIDDMKEREIPMIVKAEVAQAKGEISQVVNVHEDRFIHRQKGTASTSKVPPASSDITGMKVPKWLIYAGIFVGAMVVSGGIVLAKYLFS